MNTIIVSAAKISYDLILNLYEINLTD